MTNFATDSRLMTELSPISRSILMFAAVMGNVEVVKHLLDTGASIDKADPQGRTALMVAACEGHCEVVRFLSNKAANINKQDVKGMTALIYAIMKNNLGVVKTLCQHGANIHNMDNDGDDPYKYSEDHPDIREYLVSLGAVPSVSVRSLRMSHLSVKPRKGGRSRSRSRTRAREADVKAKSKTDI